MLTLFVTLGSLIYALAGLFIRQEAYSQFVAGKLVRHGRLVRDPKVWATVVGVFWLPLVLWGCALKMYEGLSDLVRLK